MANRRSEIELSSEELAELHSKPRVISVATNGRDGWPHVAALWYVLENSNPWIWTYGKSQKVRNLERDNRSTLLIEEGAAYNELRGAMIRCEAVIHRDPELVLKVGEKVLRKYVMTEAGELDKETLEGLKARSAKRVAVEFKVVQTVSWDHRRL